MPNECSKALRAISTKYLQKYIKTIKQSTIMKLIKTLAIMALCAGSFTACNSTAKQDNQTETAAVEELTVDQIWENPDSFVGKEITVTGVCSHLCKHGGRKAFLMPSNGTTPLRCDASPAFGSFAKETIRQPLAVTGKLHEDKIDEAFLQSWEKQYAAQLAAMKEGQGLSGEAAEEAAGGCDTEKAAHGQADITSFEGRMADYRAKIAARAEKEGKPYVSSYVFEANSYEILPQ